jgi:hypothetical protein
VYKLFKQEASFFVGCWGILAISKLGNKPKRNELLQLRRIWVRFQGASKGAYSLSVTIDAKQLTSYRPVRWGNSSFSGPLKKLILKMNLTDRKYS